MYLMSALLVNMPNVTDECRKMHVLLSLGCVFIKAKVAADCRTSRSIGLGLAVGGKLLDGVAATCDTRLVNSML